MTSTQIEKNLKNLVENFSKDEFIYDLLLAYGISKTSITRLKKGDFNLAKNVGEVLYKKKVFFKVVDQDKLLTTIDEISKEESILKHSPRFVIVTDFKTLLAKDMNTHQSLDIPILNISKHYDFFLPWAGQEKYLHKNENLADRRASYEMAKLYDILVQENLNIYDDGGHNLNIFLSRILFCFFAEDTAIFHEEGIFTTTLAQHTKEDGSDVAGFLDRLFLRLNTENANNFPSFLKKFPYVNGGLFRDTIRSPKFSKKARFILLECGQLNWSDINPDIFGSMIQAVVNPSYRSGLGMHYTSVPNIMKVIEPLFLNELYEEFDKAKDSPNRLKKLIYRIANIKIFDPACGSGNFLIIAYKELRRLEIQILSRLSEIQNQQTIVFTEINLSNFYGIEIDDFAHEMAILSLWLAEHQMNKVFEEDLYDFGRSKPILPLKEAGQIVCANANRVDWTEICPINYQDEIYILGNPPYLGSRNQDKEQKADMKFIFGKDYKSLDYVSCWFYLGSRYISGYNAQMAFVSTNSLCQGEQVALTWPRILNEHIEIGFAHQSFKWTNSAKGNAGVTVIIVGLRNQSSKDKFLYESNIEIKAKNITPYLSDGSNIYVRNRSTPISELPIMTYGNMPLEGGFLRYNNDEKSKIEKIPGTRKFIRKVVGGEEFLKGIDRYCFWIDDNDLDEARRIEEIATRIGKVKNFRQNGGEVARTLVNKSHQFRYRHEPLENQIVVPCTSSETREYIPCGFFDKEYISLNSIQTIYDAEPWIFGVISSKIHMIWVRSVGGQLETRIRYSAKLCYNTFPFPSISQKQKEQLNLHVFQVLEEREKHPEKTIAQLYDPDRMPKGLQEAHHELDLAVERCYRLKPFDTDTERLEYLFREYKQMISKNRTTNTEA